MIETIAYHALNAQPFRHGSAPLSARGRSRRETSFEQLHHRVEGTLATEGVTERAGAVAHLGVQDFAEAGGEPIRVEAGEGEGVSDAEAAAAHAPERLVGEDGTDQRG